MVIEEYKLKNKLFTIAKVVGLMGFYVVTLNFFAFEGDNFLSFLAKKFELNFLLDNSNSFTFLLSYSFVFIGFLCFLTLVLKFVLKTNLAGIGLFSSPQNILFWQGTFQGAFLMFLGSVLMFVLGYLDITEIQFSLFDFLCLGITFLLVAIHEEILARGILISLMNHAFKPYISLLISSLIFGALHLFNANVTYLSFVNICLAGVWLGISYIYKLNLLFPIGLHFGWNFFQGPVLGFEVSGNTTFTILKQQLFGSSLYNGGAFGFEGSVFAIPVLVIGVFWIYQKFAH